MVLDLPGLVRFDGVQVHGLRQRKHARPSKGTTPSRRCTATGRGRLAVVMKGGDFLWVEQGTGNPGQRESRTACRPWECRVNRPMVHCTSPCRIPPRGIAEDPRQLVRSDEPQRARYRCGASTMYVDIDGTPWYRERGQLCGLMRWISCRCWRRQSSFHAVWLVARFRDEGCVDGHGPGVSVSGRIQGLEAKVSFLRFVWSLHRGVGGFGGQSLGGDVEPWALAVDLEDGITPTRSDGAPGPRPSVPCSRMRSGMSGSARRPADSGS